MHINFSMGGFQGGRGQSYGAEFFVENIFEELDDSNEWFYNDTTQKLYYFNNITNGKINDRIFEATKLKILMNINGSRNLTVRGITFQDAAYTEFEPHSMPSGGDWTIQRIGALTMTNAEDVNIENNAFIRNDGLAIILNRYNRNVSIVKNDFLWNGDTAIALVGDTVGFDFDDSAYSMGYNGTTGSQPRNILIASNYARELGIFEKQSSFFFQAKSCQNTIKNNIFFNGPRAGINFNDGFGGGSKVQSNLLFNTCRESGDHGPFNSWDRQVFVTKVNDGKTPSTQKAFDHIFGNLFIANYHSQNAIDNDDGSCYYKIYQNLLVYSPNGQKADSGGHDNWAFDNIYAYLYVTNGWDWWGPTCFHDFTDQLVGHRNYYFNNTCVIGNSSDEITIGYAKWNGCDDGGIAFNETDMETWTVMHDNDVYIQEAKLGLCNMTEIEFQQKTGLDNGTVVHPKLPNDNDLIAQAKRMLWNAKYSTK